MMVPRARCKVGPGVPRAPRIARPVRPVSAPCRFRTCGLHASALRVRDDDGGPARPGDLADRGGLHGLIRGSFVPPPPIQELRDLTRTRKQLVGEIARHTQRLQKTLEDANVKLTRVVTDILGASGRAILAALIGGETDPERVARTSSRRCTVG